MNSVEQELLARTDELLQAIARGDWKTYERLCDARLTAFEPEARGHLVEGLSFHRFYFDLLGNHPGHTTISAPQVRVLGEDVGLVCYVRLVQSLDAAGRPQTTKFEETRVWQRQDGQWRHVHFHRSANA